MSPEQKFTPDFPVKRGNMLGKVTSFCCCGLLLPALVAATSSTVAAQDWHKSQIAPMPPHMKQSGGGYVEGSVESPSRRRLAGQTEIPPNEVPAAKDIIEGDQSVKEVTAEKTGRRLSDVSLEVVKDDGAVPHVTPAIGEEKKGDAEKGGATGRRLRAKTLGEAADGEPPRRLTTEEEHPPLELPQKIGVVAAVGSAEAFDQIAGANNEKTASQSPGRRLANDDGPNNSAGTTEEGPKQANLRLLHCGDDGSTKEQHGEARVGDAEEKAEGYVAAEQGSSDVAGNVHHICNCQHSKKGLRNLSAALRGTGDVAAASAMPPFHGETESNTGPSSVVSGQDPARRLGEKKEIPAPTQANPAVAPETNRHLSEKQDNVPVAPETARHLSEKQDNVPVAPETNRHLSEKQDNVPVAPETARHLSEKQDNVPVAPEAARHLSDQKDDVLAVPEANRRLSEKRDNVPVAPEAARHLSDQKDDVLAVPEANRRLSEKKDVVPGSPKSETATRRLLEGEFEQKDNKKEDGTEESVGLKEATAE